MPQGGYASRTAGSLSNGYPPAMPAVHSFHQSYQVPRASNSIGAAAPRPSYVAQGGATRPSEDFHNTMAQWQSRLNTESSRLQTLESESTQLQSEEVALRTRLQEIQVENRQLDQEYINAQHAWSRLYELENRYYNEPVPDFTQDILSWQYEAATATKRLDETAAELEALRAEVQSLGSVADKRREQISRLQRLEGRFTSIDERRRKCLEVAERVFDVESELAQVLGEELASLETEVAAYHIVEEPQQPPIRRQRSEAPNQQSTNASILKPSGRFSVGEQGGPLRTLPANVAPARTTTSIGVIGRHARELAEDCNVSRRSSFARPTTAHTAEVDCGNSSGNWDAKRPMQTSPLSEDLGGTSMCLGLDDDAAGQSMVFSLAPPSRVR